MSRWYWIKYVTSSIYIWSIILGKDASWSSYFDDLNIEIYWGMISNAEINSSGSSSPYDEINFLRSAISLLSTVFMIDISCLTVALKSFLRLTSLRIWGYALAKMEGFPSVLRSLLALRWIFSSSAWTFSKLFICTKIFSKSSTSYYS